MRTNFVRNRTRKNLTDLRGKIIFADGYDYKALGSPRSDIEPETFMRGLS